MRVNLLARKPLAEITSEAQESGAAGLSRSLGAWNLLALGLGAIIGTGIFVLTGPAAARYAGPAIVFSFVIAAVACLFSGLCYAEFAAMIPVAGSAYTYGYATLGEIFAWIIGWDLILEYAFGAATVCSGWSGYVLSLGQDFGLRLPPELAGTPGATFVLFEGHWEYLGRISNRLREVGTLGIPGSHLESPARSRRRSSLAPAEAWGLQPGRVSRHPVGHCRSRQGRAGVGKLQ